MKDIRQQWKEKAAKKDLSSSDMVALAIIKAIAKDGGTLESAIYFLRKAFTPITNSTKLENGHYKWRGLYVALYYAQNNQILEAALETEDEIAKAKSIMTAIRSGLKYGRGEL